MLKLTINCACSLLPVEMSCLRLVLYTGSNGPVAFRTSQTVTVLPGVSQTLGCCQENREMTCPLMDGRRWKFSYLNVSVKS